MGNNASVIRWLEPKTDFHFSKVCVLWSPVHERLAIQVTYKNGELMCPSHLMRPIVSVEENVVRALTAEHGLFFGVVRCGSHVLCLHVRCDFRERGKSVAVNGGRRKHTFIVL